MVAGEIQYRMTAVDISSYQVDSRTTKILAQTGPWHLVDFAEAAIVVIDTEYVCGKYLRNDILTFLRRKHSGEEKISITPFLRCLGSMGGHRTVSKSHKIWIHLCRSHR